MAISVRRLWPMKSGKASGKFCPFCEKYCKGYPVKCRHCGRRFVV